MDDITAPQSGFTLIELSIVLVIIGLVIGGIVVGKELIESAAVRSQVSQIQNFNTAVNAFKGKYNCLPGDCASAASYGFVSRSGIMGRGNGDGAITSVAALPYVIQMSYEHILFWRDLSDAGLISEAMQGTDAAYTPSSTVLVPSFFPTGKINSGTAILAYSGGWGNFNSRLDPFHYFAIGGQTFSAIPGRFTPANGTMGMTVAQAYGIDAKIDDGLPQTGTVFAYIPAAGWTFGYNSWATYMGLDAATGGPITASTVFVTTVPATSLTCYDNGGVANASTTYSMSTDSGNGKNCHLSIRMQ